MKYLSFQPDMAQAWARGDKRETRRVMKPQPPERAYSIIWEEHENEYDSSAVLGNPLRCPLGSPGDVVTLLTTWAVPMSLDSLKPSQLDSGQPIWHYFDSPKVPKYYGKLRPGRFLPLFLRYQMPRARIVSIGVERVQDITEEGARFEGVKHVGVDTVNHRHGFQQLWDRINKKRGYGWDANPLVWVYRLEPV